MIKKENVSRYVLTTSTMSQEEKTKLETKMLILLKGVNLLDAINILENVNMYIQCEAKVPEAFSFSDTLV